MHILDLGAVQSCNGPFSADVSRAHTNFYDSGKRPTNQMLAACTKVLRYKQDKTRHLFLRSTNKKH